eukprot:1158689-Pelagomonas_calceolata.AAC.15
MPGCVGFVVRAHCKRVPGRHRVTGLRSSSNDDNQATTQPALQVAEQPAGEAHAQQPSISNHGMSIEIPFEEPDRMEKFWTRARLAFALPWRRFKKGSVLTIKGRQAASMMHEGECPS